MSLEATLATWELTDLTPIEKLLLLSFARRAGEDHECWPSVKRICSDTGLDRKTVISFRKKLIRAGLLTYTGEMKGKSYQIPVMKLTYVDKFEQKINSTVNGTSTVEGTGKNFTGTINGMGTSTVEGTGTSTVYGTLNIKEEKINNNIIGASVDEPTNPPCKPEEKPKPAHNKSSKATQVMEIMLADNPYQISDQVLLDWIEVRRTKRAPVTHTAWMGILRELARCERNGLKARDCFSTVVGNGWQSFRMEWLMEQEKPGKGLPVNNDFIL